MPGAEGSELGRGLAAARAISGSADPDYAVPAFASAVHDALAALVPAQRPQLDTALTATLAAIPGGAAKNRGIAAGQRAAAAVLNERTADGLDTASVDIPWVQPPPAPGVYQLTPPNYAPATLAGQGRARPFLLTSGSQFRLGPPPELDSATYLNNLAEVHAYGSPASSVRTTAQTDVALFWAQASLAAYIQVVRAVLADSARPLSWQARLVAAFHAITIDGRSPSTTRNTCTPSGEP